MSTTLVWFRQDLRLTDNPALYEAAQCGKVLAVYIDDDRVPEPFKLGSASQWWLHHSLTKLNQQLTNHLHLYQGNAEEIILSLIEAHEIDSVYWNRCYEPWRIQDDAALKLMLKRKGIVCRTFDSALLWEPMNILKHDGSPYKVFTPFYQGCVKAAPPRQPLPKPSSLSLIKATGARSIDALGLLPSIPWFKQLAPHWHSGEQGAYQQLSSFVTDGLIGYKTNRDFPALPNVSRLSPHLHFGELSPHQVWAAVQSASVSHQVPGYDAEYFLRELAWREFSYYLLYHFPDLPTQNFQSKFDYFPWQTDSRLLTAWQKGQTGYPFIDAGMRQLWQTGYIHNRVRMIVASFLVKNLLIDWRCGAAWFWDCLVDADLANNSAGWQWVAGSGADAAPYFRIFNPITQGEKFDPDGVYTRHFVPELATLPKQYLFKPWEAPTEILNEAGIVLGKTYPLPIVELAGSRQRALDAFASLKTLF